MTPFSFEWHWNVEYLIFMGFLYLALGIVGCGLVVAYIKTWMDVESGESQDETESPDMSSRSHYSKF